MFSSLQEHSDIAVGDSSHVRCRDMSALVDELVNLKREMVAAGREVAVRSLRPGCSQGTVESALAVRGLPVPVALIEYFEWHDGVEEPADGVMDDVQVFPGFYAMPLFECVASYDAFVGDGRWDSSWFPLLANGGGDFYVADLGTPVPAIKHFRIDENLTPAEFSSLESFVAAIVEALALGVVYIEDGYLEMDDMAFGEIAARREPDLAWWRG